MTAMSTGAASMPSMPTSAPAQGSAGGTSKASAPTAQEAPKLESRKFLVKTESQQLQACEWIAAQDISEDRPASIEFKSWEEKRSELQNRYLWGWLYRNIAQQLEAAGIVIPLDDGREYPYNADMLHEIFKDRFLCHDTIMCKGRERKVCYSTTQLLKKPKEGDEQRGFKNYVEQVKQFAYQMWGIHIPPTFNEDYRSLERELQENYR